MSLQAELAEINEVFRKPVDMVMTVADDMAFADATGCHVCGGDLDNERVRDHCHITGPWGSPQCM